MAKAKNWAVTDYSGEKAMTLTIDGVGDFDVVQFTATFAKNEVPRCTCMVSIGRDARSKDAATRAKIHEMGTKLTQMKPARIYFEPQGDWKPSSTKQWQGRKVIFEGYYQGLAYRKILDKVQPVIHLTHWLCDLGFSSTLTSNLHPSVVGSLGGVACMGVMSGNPGGLGLGKGGAVIEGSGELGRKISFLGDMSYADVIEDELETDLWTAVKSIFCDLAQDDRWKPDLLSDLVGGTGCIDGEGWKQNDRALRALKRIEGPTTKTEGAPDCSMDYKYAKPLALDVGEHLANVSFAIATAINQRTLESYAGTTFWEALLMAICPEFGLSVIPMVDRALIIADCPAGRKTWKKGLKPDDYDQFDFSGMISLPLWGVGLMAQHHSNSGAEGNDGDSVPPIGGGFISEAEENSDGMLIVQEAPSWLNWLTLCEEYADESTGAKKEDASRTLTTDADPPVSGDKPSPKDVAISACELLKRSAQQIFIENMLRGRGAQIAGKLRFDIAPGSIVKIEAKPELFEDGVDELAVTMYAQVNRVTVNINAEARAAGTTFSLTHIRTETENGKDRTSAAGHPLFGEDIYVGAPLVDDDWLFPEDEEANPANGADGTSTPGGGQVMPGNFAPTPNARQFTQ